MYVYVYIYADTDTETETDTLALSHQIHINTDALFAQFHNLHFEAGDFLGKVFTV